MKLLFSVLALVCAVVLLASAPRFAMSATSTLPVERKTAAAETTYQGKTIRWWAKRAVQARKDANARGRTIKRLRAELRRRHEPSIEHYFTIAARTYADGLRRHGYTRADLERRGRCESVNFTDFYNETPIYNGEHAQGIMGFIPSTFASTPFAGLDVRYDHLANIMAGAWMHSVGRGGEWACR